MQQFECKICNQVAKSLSGFDKHYKNAHFAMDALSQLTERGTIYSETEAAGVN